jgi:hypothetical protein
VTLNLPDAIANSISITPSASVILRTFKLQDQSEGARRIDSTSRITSVWW